jgi:predicted MFS family arabinose efflux permease
MTYYIEPTVNDTADFFSFFNYINNTASGGIFFPLILLAIGIITTIGSALTGKPVQRGFTFAAFICSILGMLLVLMGFMNKEYMYFCFFLTAVGVVWIRLSEGLS